MFSLFTVVWELNAQTFCFVLIFLCDFRTWQFLCVCVNCELWTGGPLWNLLNQKLLCNSRSFFDVIFLNALGNDTRMDRCVPCGRVCINVRITMIHICIYIRIWTRLFFFDTSICMGELYCCSTVETVFINYSMTFVSFFFLNRGKSVGGTGAPFRFAK